MEERENKSYVLSSLLLGVSLGAAIMYFLDPTKGHRRRVMVRDKIFNLVRRVESRRKKISTDFKNRAWGATKELERRRRDESVDDGTLKQRVRSEFGRKVSHARAIKVDVHNGIVTLSGPILTHEVKRLIKSVENVPGVISVQDHLSKYDEAGDISSLQGKGAGYFQ